jgi:hypothetical protein
MTDEMMAPGSILEKSFDADLLREMIGFAAQRLTEVEVQGLTGTAHGERDQPAQRYRERPWETRRHNGAAYPQAAQRQVADRLPPAALLMFTTASVSGSKRCPRSRTPGTSRSSAEFS